VADLEKDIALFKQAATSKNKETASLAKEFLPCSKHNSQTSGNYTKPRNLDVNPVNPLDGIFIFWPLSVQKVYGDWSFIW
jgi:hypothetical protein